MTKTLMDWREVIEEEVDFVDIKPFSHNIIGLALSAVAKDHGNDVANDLIDDFGLEALGWRKVEGGQT